MTSDELLWLHPESLAFPPLEQALTEPDGLLAVGGDLSMQRLIKAYRNGIFPWYEDPQPILWWSPNPRCILEPERFHESRSLRKSLRRYDWRITTNVCFDRVIDACASCGDRRSATWINSAMQQAYLGLHHAGYAHSIEVWLEQDLVGGLYGVGIDRVFFGESMFSLVSDASKIALSVLSTMAKHHHWEMIDCQVGSPHLYRMGASDCPRQQFAKRLQAACPMGLPIAGFEAERSDWSLAAAPHVGVQHL